MEENKVENIEELQGNTEKPEKKKLSKEQLHKRLFWVRMPVFVIGMLILLTYVIFVLTPKYPYGICSMHNYYKQEPGTIDVLALGTSLTYVNLNPNILWADYGIACYDLATAEQPYWSTYYYLKEALKYQKPKVVLLDLKANCYREDKVDRTRTVLCTFGILDPVNRIKAIMECVEPEEALGYILAFPQIHTNYQNLHDYDFDLASTCGYNGPSWKGYVEKEAWAEHDPPDIEFNDRVTTLNEHETEFFRKILEFCQEKDVPVMLVGYPNADYKHDHYSYNTAFGIAKEYGITGVNYNYPEYRPPIDYHKDCADWQHLNVRGSVTFSKTLGADLVKYCNLEDHRGDPKYDSWQDQAERWFKKYPSYTPEGWGTN